MSDIRVITETISEQWNAVAPHPLQSWEWGEVRKATGIEVLRIAEFEQQTLIKTFQTTIHKIPHTPYTIGYIPRSTFPTEPIIHFLTSLKNDHNTIFVTFEPNVAMKDVSEISSQLSESAHPLFPRWSQIIDTTQPEEVLWQRLKPKTRYNIGLAQRKGVVVREMTNDEGFEIFADLYFETCKRQKYRGHTKSYHKNVFDHMKAHMAHILIAFYENTPLSAYELFHFKNTLYYPYGGSSVEHRDLMGSNLLMWEAIRLGKSLGVTSFDLWGSLSPDYDHTDPWAGFTRFKEGYNAEFVEFAGSYDLVLQPALYKVYGVMNTIRKRLM